MLAWLSASAPAGPPSSSGRGGATPGTVLFTWDELGRGFGLALAQNAVSVGDSVWVQAEGLPIGGLQPGQLQRGPWGRRGHLD